MMDSALAAVSIILGVLTFALAIWIFRRQSTAADRVSEAIARALLPMYDRQLFRRAQEKELAEDMLNINPQFPHEGEKVSVTVNSWQLTGNYLISITSPSGARSDAHMFLRGDTVTETATHPDDFHPAEPLERGPHDVAVRGSDSGHDAQECFTGAFWVLADSPNLFDAERLKLPRLLFWRKH